MFVLLYNTEHFNLNLARNHNSSRQAKTVKKKLKSFA